MVEDSIPDQSNIVVPALDRKIYQVLLRSPFGRHSTFLLEFAQVICVVYVVTVAFSVFCFRSWRQPEPSYANRCKTGQYLLQPPPMFVICRRMPLECFKENRIR